MKRGEARVFLGEKLFLRDMDKYLVQEYERALFDLPPRPPGEKGDPPA